MTVRRGLMCREGAVRATEVNRNTEVPQAAGRKEAGAYEELQYRVGIHGNVQRTLILSVPRGTNVLPLGITRKDLCSRPYDQSAM